MLHLHTQYNRDLPWAEIDMDFMNLNQSAHGDREFGYLATRMRHRRKIVVGHWEDPEVHAASAPGRAPRAAGTRPQRLRIARFGDNMRDVAVTEGDKVEAQIRLGYLGERLRRGRAGRARARDRRTRTSTALVKEYEERLRTSCPSCAGAERATTSLRDAARIELGLRAFLDGRRSEAFTDTFEDLAGPPRSCPASPCSA